MEEEKTLTLRSNDDQVFTVKESVAIQSLTIKNMVEEGWAGNTIPVYNVDGKTLALVLEYLNLHGDSAISEKDKEKFDAEFVKRELTELLNLLLAANFLATECLKNFLLDIIAGHMKEMTVEKVRETFNVQNDYTSDEEAEVRQRYAWAFE